MRPRTQTRPSSVPPILPHRQTFELKRVVDRNHAVDFAVRVFVVLAGEFFNRIEVDGCEGHVEVCGGGEHDLQSHRESVSIGVLKESKVIFEVKTDLPTSILRPVNLVRGYPAFF